MFVKVLAANFGTRPIEEPDAAAFDAQTSRPGFCERAEGRWDVATLYLLVHSERGQRASGSLPVALGSLPFALEAGPAALFTAEQGERRGYLCIVDFDAADRIGDGRHEGRGHQIETDCHADPVAGNSRVRIERVGDEMSAPGSHADRDQDDRGDDQEQDRWTTAQQNDGQNDGGEQDGPTAQRKPRAQDRRQPGAVDRGDREAGTQPKRQSRQETQGSTRTAAAMIR